MTEPNHFLIFGFVYSLSDDTSTFVKVFYSAQKYVVKIGIISSSDQIFSYNIIDKCEALSENNCFSIENIDKSQNIANTDTKDFNDKNEEQFTVLMIINEQLSNEVSDIVISNGKIFYESSKINIHRNIQYPYL